MLHVLRMLVVPLYLRMLVVMLCSLAGLRLVPMLLSRLVPASLLMMVPLLPLGTSLVPSLVMLCDNQSAGSQKQT